MLCVLSRDGRMEQVDAAVTAHVQNSVLILRDAAGAVVKPVISTDILLYGTLEVIEKAQKRLRFVEWRSRQGRV